MKKTMIVVAAGILGSCLLPCLDAVAKESDGRQGNWRNSLQGAPALEEAKKRAEENPKSADAQNDYGWALRQNGKSTEAEPVLRQAIKLNPEMPQAHSNLSVVLQDEGEAKNEEALAEARKAVSLNPNEPIFMVVLGNAFALNKDYKQAEESYRNAIKLRKDYENAYYHLGRVLHLAGQNVDAQKELSIALGLDPNDDRVIELLDKLFK